MTFEKQHKPFWLLRNSIDAVAEFNDQFGQKIDKSKKANQALVGDSFAKRLQIASSYDLQKN